MSCGSNFSAHITVEGNVHMVGLYVPGHIVPPVVGVVTQATLEQARSHLVYIRRQKELQILHSMDGNWNTRGVNAQPGFANIYFKGQIRSGSCRFESICLFCKRCVSLSH